MSRIDLRGVIVPSEYDTDWARNYINKGIIMPESHFRTLLSTASKGEPLTVYVNSPGGSIFSAGEMVNAVREWKTETKQPVVILLGALTASAASAFAIMTADTIKAHSNAKMMFHGAWTLTIGGKELHQDTAELLEKINADIKTRLVSKYGMAPEVVSEWFAEGREGWLSAQELVDAKLASEIIADPSDVIEFPSDALGEIENRGLGIAALLNQNNDKQEDEHDGGTADQHSDAGTGDHGGDAGAGDGTQQNGQPGQADSTSDQYRAGIDAGRALQVAEDAEKIAALTDQARKLQSDRDKARAEVDRLTAELANTKAAGEKAVADLTATSQEAISKLTSEHAAELADMKQTLATVQRKCERLVSGGMTFSPDTAEKAGRTANDVDPRKRLHPALR